MCVCVCVCEREESLDRKRKESQLIPSIVVSCCSATVVFWTWQDDQW